MNTTFRLKVLKHTIYVVALLILYVIQSSPGFLEIYKVKPIWVIPAAIAISMFEDEFAGGIYGALAGLLCDTGGFLLFGFNGFIVTLCCVAAGLLVIYLMRCNLLTCLLFVFVTLLVRGSIEYFFAYGMWNYENSALIYTISTFPTIVYSTIVAAPMFFFVQSIHRRFSDIEEGGL